MPCRGITLTLCSMEREWGERLRLCQAALHAKEVESAHENHAEYWRLDLVH